MDHNRRQRLAQLITATQPGLRVSVTRSLSELENQIKSLGLPLPAKYGKQELVKILSDHFWEQKNPGKPKPNFESPSLSRTLQIFRRRSKKISGRMNRDGLSSLKGMEFVVWAIWVHLRHSRLEMFQSKIFSPNP